MNFFSSQPKKQKPQKSEPATAANRPPRSESNGEKRTGSTEVVGVEGALSPEMRKRLADNVNPRAGEGGKKDKEKQKEKERREKEKDAILREKKAQLAELKREREKAHQACKELICRLQPGGGGPVEQRAVQLMYDVETDRWTQQRCKIKLDSKPLAEGGMRWCVKMVQDTDGRREEAVAKFFKADVFRSRKNEIRCFFAEALTSMYARYLAIIFNKAVGKAGLQPVVRPIKMLPASVAVLVELKDQVISIEPILEGKFEKHNDNDGNISSTEDLPQAFSHFTLHASGGSVLVVDIQGVGNNYTDPQIHSIDGKGFGVGNIGKQGMEAFIKTHKCNTICKKLGLPPPQLPTNLETADGIWSKGRFDAALRVGIEKSGLTEGLIDRSNSTETLDEAAEKTRLLLLLAQKKLLMAKLSQAQALMEVSSAEGDAKSQSHLSSSAPASGALTPVLSTPTENDALLARRAFLQQQIEMKKMELLMQTEQAEREQVEDVRDAAPAQMNSTLEAEAGSGLQRENRVVLDNSQHILEQQKRSIAMQIIQKHKVLREKVLEESRRDGLAASCGHVSPRPMENVDHLRGNTTDIISELSNFQSLGTTHDTSVLQRASPPVTVRPVPMPSYSSAPDLNANAAHTGPQGMPTAVKMPAVELTPAAAMENFSAAELLKKLDLARAAKTAPLSSSSATLPKDASLNTQAPKAASQSESSVTSATAASLPSSSKTTKVSPSMPAEGNKIVHSDETVPHHPSALQAVSISASIPRAAPQCAPSLPTPKAASPLGHNRMVNQDQAASVEAGNNANHISRQVKGVCAICRSPVFVDQERMKDQQGSYVHAQCSSMPSYSSAPDLNANAAHTGPQGMPTAVKMPAVELTPTAEMAHFSAAELLKKLDLARAAKTAPLSSSSATLPKDASLNTQAPKAASQSESSVTSATAASLPSSSKTTKVSPSMPAEGNKIVHSDETVPHHPSALQAVSISASIPRAAPQCAPSLPTPKAASPLGHNRMVNQDQAASVEAGNNANHISRQVKGVCAICRSPVFVDQERMKDQQGSYVHAQCSSMPSYSSAPDLNANAAHTGPQGMPTAVKMPAVELTPTAEMAHFSAAELLKKLDLARAAKTAPLSSSSATLPKDASLNTQAPKAASQSESSVTSATAASLPSSSKTIKVSPSMPAEGNKIVHSDETVPHHPAALQAVSISASIPRAAPQCAPSLPTPKAASPLGHNRMVNQDQAASVEAGNNANHISRQVKGVCAICRSPVFVDQERMKDQQGSYVHAQCSSMPSYSSAPDLNANAAHKAAMAALPQSSSVSVQVSPSMPAEVNEILYSEKTIMHPPVGAVGLQRPAVDEPYVSITGDTGKSTPVVIARASDARSTIVDETAIVISASPSHRWTAYQIVNSPLRMRLKMPEDRLLAAFKYANWFAYWILFWATCAFFFGIFSPFGFPCWGVSVPVFSLVGLLFGYCLPTQPPDDGKTMPRSIRILTTLIMMWAAASAFTAGILSAFSVESIRPLLLTPVCMSTTELNSTSPLPQSPSSPVETNVAAATPTLNATQAHTTQAESTDEEKLRSCKAWNMCNDGGIKMLSCGRLMSINEWNTVFFFLSSFILPALYMWVYYVISVRLHEFHVAIVSGFTEVKDVSFRASLARVFSCICQRRLSPKSYSSASTRALPRS